MVCLSQKILYFTPEEMNSFCDCSLHSSVIQFLNKKYNDDHFKDIPCSLTNIITTYTNVFFGCVNEFATKYRKLKHEFKSKIYSIAINSGVECFYEAYDKGDHDCLYELLMPRVNKT